MVAIRQRNDPVRLFGRRVLLLLLFLLVCAVAWGLWGAYEKERDSSLLRADAEGQLHDIAQRQEQLNADIANLQTRRGVEEVLREQYALAAKDEGLIVIVGQDVATPTEATTTMFEKIQSALHWW